MLNLQTLKQGDLPSEEKWGVVSSPFFLSGGNSKTAIYQPFKRSYLLHIYVPGYTVEPAINIPGLERQDVRAFGGAECLMKGRPK